MIIIIIQTNYYYSVGFIISSYMKLVPYQQNNHRLLEEKYIFSFSSTIPVYILVLHEITYQRLPGHIRHFISLFVISSLINAFASSSLTSPIIFSTPKSDRWFLWYKIFHLFFASEIDFEHTSSPSLL